MNRLLGSCGKHISTPHRAEKLLDYVKIKGVKGDRLYKLLQDRHSHRFGKTQTILGENLKRLFGEEKKKPVCKMAHHSSNPIPLRIPLCCGH